MKGVGAFFKKWSKNIIVSLICTFMLCAGIGYAQVTRPLNIKSDFDAHAEEGIFITDASYKSGNNVSAADNTVGEFYSTIFNGRAALHTSDTGSYATFSVVIRNNYDYPYRFKKLDKITSIYTNEQIDCVASFPDGSEVVQPRDFITVDITFSYIDNPDLSASSNTYADFSINIDFNIYIKPVLADNMVPVEYNQTTQTWDKANEDSFNYADYDSGVWANAVTYDHGKAFSQNEYTTNGGTYFDGSTYYINYRHENYDFDSNITVGARFKWTGTADNSLGYLICNLESAGFGLFVVNEEVENSTQRVGQLGFRYLNDEGITTTIYSNTIIQQNTWTSLIATYDGQNVKIYIDGVLDKTSNATGNIKPSEVAIHVGHNPDLSTSGTGGFHFKGNISHVMVLNATLTDEIVKQVHNTKFRYSTKEYNEIFNLDITSRSSNGKYFDGKTDNGYNLGKAGYDFNKNNLAQFSVAVKFNIMSLEGNTNQYLVCGLQTYGFGFGFSKNSKSLYFAMYNEITAGFIYVTASEALDLKQWYTAVVTVDGYNIRMYVDGREQTLSYTTSNGATYNPGTTTLKLKNSSVNLAMGGNPDANNNVNTDMFTGWISDCVVFSKALSTSEISRDFVNDFAFHYKNYSTSSSATDVVQYVKYDYDNIILNSQDSYTEEGIVLDGSRDYICVGLGNHNFNTELTIAIRLKFKTIPSGARAIVSNYENAGFQLDINSNKNFEFYARHNNGTTTAVATASNVTVQEDTWYTLACVVTTNGLRLYINGTEQASTSGSFVLKNCMHPIFIGANPNEGAYSGMANIVVSDYAFINESFNSTLVSRYFTGEITPELVRANCFLNFVGYEYREDNHSIPEEMITGHYTWIPRFKVKSTLESGEVDIEIVAKTTAAHDAFTFNGVELEGFWFSKFENSINASGNIQSVANADIYITDNISTMFNRIKQIENNNIGFNVSNYSMLNIHMSKNSEWGAMAYFAQSKYGLFRTGELATIQANNTLIAGSNYEVNTNQSTTQNITGIYDIVGGANEYVMANYDSMIGSSEFETLPDSYYYDVYSTLDSYYNSNLYHAMGEVDSYPSDDNSVFVSSSNPWLVRSGLFDYSAASGGAGYSSRTVIAVVK